jgi:hypothetical protein
MRAPLSSFDLAENPAASATVMVAFAGRTFIAGPSILDALTNLVKATTPVSPVLAP